MPGDYLGVVLAGGQSRRMGQDKALLPFGNNRTLFDHVLHHFGRQIDNIIISTANHDSVFTHCGHDLVGDIAPFERLGPLSGLYAAFDYCQKSGQSYRGLITVAVDTPFFPNDYVAQLRAMASSHPCCPLIAATGKRQHPTFALWPLDVASALHHHLETGKRSILSFAAQVGMQTIVFPPSSTNEDPFFNINNQQEWELACHRLSMLGCCE